MHLSPASSPGNGLHQTIADQRHGIHFAASLAVNTPIINILKNTIAYFAAIKTQTHSYEINFALHFGSIGLTPEQLRQEGTG